MTDALLIEAAAGSTSGNATASVMTTDTPRMFNRIHSPLNELIVWRRRLDSRLAPWLASMPVANLPSGRLDVAPRHVGQMLDEMFQASGTPDDAMRVHFRADLVHLTRLFADVMEIASVDFRLEAIHGNACWKFHRDCVQARLLTTYCGPGTQWVEPAFAQKALDEQRDYRGPIEEFQLHDVGLFKGEYAPPASGIVHRSPPVAGTGRVRLILCLNLPQPVPAHA
jgi:hypothetical protein